MKKYLGLAVTLGASGSAFAEGSPVDTAVQAGVATLGTGVGQIAAVGGAMIALAATAVVIKWVKASFFG